MGLTCRLQTEQGESLAEVRDERGTLSDLIPPIADESFHCLRFIDLYGDTVFNRLQMPRFLDEWHRIREGVSEREPARIAEQIEALARQCQDGVHLYLKFYGD